jgi:hypothetical protein
VHTGQHTFDFPGSTAPTYQPGVFTSSDSVGHIQIIQWLWGRLKFSDGSKEGQIVEVGPMVDSDCMVISGVAHCGGVLLRFSWDSGPFSRFTDRLK